MNQYQFRLAMLRAGWHLTNCLTTTEYWRRGDERIEYSYRLGTVEYHVGARLVEVGDFTTIGEKYVLKGETIGQ